MDTPLLYLPAGKRREQAYATDVADGLKVYANEAADYAARMIRSLRAAGLKESEIDRLKDQLTDTFSSVQGGIDRVLDDEGLSSDGHQIDLTEVLP